MLMVEVQMTEEEYINITSLTAIRNAYMVLTWSVMPEMCDLIPEDERMAVCRMMKSWEEKLSNTIDIQDS